MPHTVIEDNSGALDRVAITRADGRLAYIKLSSRPPILLYVICLFNWRELVFADTAQRTLEILWEVFKRCARLNASLWHTCFGVVFPSADIANVFFHTVNVFESVNRL